MLGEQEQTVGDGLTDEARTVLKNRYQEARRAGLSIVEAKLFADSDQDVGVLRRCVRNGWSAEQIAAVVL